MVGSRNPLVVDRRVYAFVGKWINPQNDTDNNIFYFVSTPKTLVSDFDNGLGIIRPSLDITVFGEHPFAVDDKIKLQNGEIYKIENITFNYFEPNIAIRDLLKPRVESCVLTLQ